MFPQLIYLMDAKKDSPSEIAKQTLTRLAKERLVPFPENYCQVYRKENGKTETWASFCHYTKLLEEALAELIGSWQIPDALLEPETLRIARELDLLVATASSEDDLKRVRESGRTLGLRMKRELVSGAEVQAGLIDTLHFVVSNLDSVAEEDQWLHNQILATEELLNGHISATNVSQAKELLRSVLDRQQKLHRAMAEAQHAIKGVMSELIRQASSLVADTAGFENKITELGEHIQAANDLSSIKDVVGELDVFVRDMGSSVHSTHARMSVTHSRLVEAEQQIVDLRKNLAETSEKVRRDSLTGALNRSGLDEIWQRETQQAAIDKTPLSIGILDVDNFKLLNDQLGHTVGDKALIHLTSVIRNALHGTDTMARYGGEEFVILLPDTNADGAKAVMQRLQRELTKHFFMRGNDHVLITFSAGVTVVRQGVDSMISAIERADSALYEAKRLGKNRVVAA